jgi:hypothetical protein
MKHQEKKYQIGDFAGMERQLKALGAVRENEMTTVHYYARRKDSNVTKLVEYADHCQIHELQESGGKFTLTERIPIKSRQAGLQWLKDKGFKAVDIVKMVNTDYNYQDGIVGLYIINDFLQSVILDFPEQLQAKMEAELDLKSAPKIDIPYNKYLQEIGKLEYVDL